jgi:hypothetical protein
MGSYYGTGSGSLTADPALRNHSWGITKSFGGGEAFNFNSGNKAGGMDPLSAGLGLASAGLGFISGIGQQRTAASIAQAQLAAQNAAFLEGRELNKGQLAGSLFNKLFDVGSGGDIAFGREKAGKEFLTGPYAERLMGLGSEEAKRARLAAISPESKERAQFENRLAIQRSLAEKRAQTDAMFGPISSSYRA